MLSDGTIADLLASHRLRIDPHPEDRAFQPASVDLKLGGSFLSVPDGYHFEVQHHYTIDPGECVLATTAETITLPANVVARVEGKSTWARRFLMVHSTAGFIDPGFHGKITLELKNLSPVSIDLPIGGYTAQVSFEYTDKRVLRPYGDTKLGSKYQGQTTVTGPRDHAHR